MSKEHLLEGNIFLEEEIEIKGETYIVRELSAKEASEYEGSMVKMVNGKPVLNTKNAKNGLVLLSLYQDGKRVFDDKDISLLEKLPASIVSQVFDVAAKINKLDSAENVKN